MQELCGFDMDPEPHPIFGLGITVTSVGWLTLRHCPAMCRNPACLMLQSAVNTIETVSAITKIIIKYHYRYHSQPVFTISLYLDIASISLFLVFMLLIIHQLSLVFTIIIHHIHHLISLYIYIHTYTLLSTSHQPSNITFN